jgi:glucose/arabinose dehydrogenase
MDLRKRIRTWRTLAFLVLGLLGVRALAADAPVRLRYPVALACGDDGRILVADLHLPGIARVEPSGAIEIVFRGSTRIQTPLHAPRAIANGRDHTLFVADPATGEIYKLSAGQAPVPLTAGAFEIPTGIAVAPDGDLFVTDLKLGTVARVPRSGGAVVTLARVPSPRGLAIDPNGDLIVVSAGPDALLRVAPDGTVRSIVTGRPFRFPCAVLIDEAHPGYVVSDSYAATLWAVSSQGEVRPWVQGAPLVRPEGLARDRSGAVLVADPGARQVFRIRSEREIEPLVAGAE